MPQSSSPAIPLSEERHFAGGGEMGELVRALDWSRTPLGPSRDWPVSLKTMVGVVLHNRFPMLMWWGPEMIQVYNDAYRPVLGLKHPGSLGAPGEKVWSEIWDVVGPMARGVLNGGPATWSENLALFLNSRGFVEETFHTFSYSPIPDEQGGVGGVLVTVRETTPEVQLDRQLRMLRDLAARSADAKSPEQACRTSLDVLADNDLDLPFCLLYLLDANGDTARLAGSSGLPGTVLEALPAQQSLFAEPVTGWPFAEAVRTGEDVVVKDLGQRLHGLPGGRWNTPPSLAVVRALTRPGQSRPSGFLVGGVSPRRLLDASYHAFFQATAEQVAASVANARAYQEERQRAEELAALDRAKTAFFSNISHELRTPLTLLLGPTEDALASPTRTLQGDSLETVHRNAVRLRKLVNTLLDFARIEAGRVRAAYEPTDLAALTAGLASAFRSAIERAGLTLDVDCPALPEPAWVDHEMWEKIVLNLVSNALKFTFTGTITVAQALKDGHIELRVTDTGTGIPAHELPRLFERFHRVHGARARSHEGSGIGLALVHELVRLHGGTLTVQSELDRGTTFTVRLPTGFAHLPPEHVTAAKNQRALPAGADPYVRDALGWLTDVPAPPEEDAGAPPASPGMEERGRVLLADDNADMREYVGRLLRAQWTVEAVADGEAALQAALARPPDLILSDVMMPGMDGFALIQALRADERTRTVPVILLSARAGEEAQEEGLTAGAADYLVKPFSTRDLIARVSAQLTRSRLRKLEASHGERLARIFQHAPVGIAILRGPEHVFEFANENYLKLIAHRDVTGKAIREAMPELAHQGIYELLDGVFTTGEPHIGRSLRVVFNDGPNQSAREVFFDFVYQPMNDAKGQVDSIIVVVFDVTELATARREAESANRAKDEFLAMLGHELRNPLAPILTALQLMRLRGETAAERERTLIERQVTHLVRMVDDLLDVSRVTRGKVTLKRERVTLTDVVTKAIEQTSSLIDERQHTLEVDLPDRGMDLNGDPTRLAQVFANLLTNAAKYTEPGGLLAVTGTREGRELVVTVRDTGVGIAPEMMPRVFDLFVQEHQALDRSQGGLGLGLAIARSLVTLHEGAISAHSPGRGRGSTFTVRLPALEPEAPAALPTPQPGALIAQEPSSVNARVLIVDDNRDAADVLSESLEFLGCTTRVAYDGPSGLEAAKAFRPEIALLDIGLPVMDGYELAQRLRRQEGPRPLKLVAVTGYGQESDRQRSKAAGFDAHLVKPLHFETLEALLKDLTGA
ncbi:MULTISPECIES: ATP-binding protein [unclassified Corallococcus]|uniref:ATP-binding protein n=1 Tax=unclassified Corallococcus TaxID=2685029 RepID=UPI001A8DC5FC|nr:MULTISPECIES: ATP-binding protein [unclassified Corallococcus]MBN9683876.1 response regulator [Corallococcus sp. NCSPR001]WAS84625.1 ATP-binding protein [Corallococcus sp. NCRR]